MAPDEAPQKRVPARRTRRKSVGGGELIEQLNEMVAELIRENRRLKRQVDKLTERGSAAASTAVERSLRTIQRRVQKALAGPPKRGRRKAAGKTSRRKPVTRARRKT
jgi:molybdenum-dependent DNA-binding transcriptional regulator ModE